MNDIKTIDILRKRNSELQTRLNKLEELNAEYFDESKEKHVERLIEELEEIKKQWNDVLNDLKAEKEKYTELIKDVRNIKNAFKAI